MARKTECRKGVIQCESVPVTLCCRSECKATITEQQGLCVCVGGGGEELCRDCLGASVCIGVIVIPTAWWVWLWVCLSTSHAAACPCPVYLCTMTCIVSCRTQDIFNEI